MPLNQVYVLLGGNQPNTYQLFVEARDLLEMSVGEILAVSRLYKSQSWGFDSDDLFLNQVVCLLTALQPLELLDVILGIEKKLGRIRQGAGYSSRSIDIDILFYNHLIINEPELIIPHPRLHLRNFTLVPLNEIAPDLNHPLFNKPIHQLLENCEDNHPVEPYDDNTFEKY
jgi:2-amino-4-hydroxy-6-hydroxymethyldihydropteridine diphosphokinase